MVSKRKRQWRAVIRQHGTLCYICHELVDISLVGAWLHIGSGKNKKPDPDFLKKLPTLDHVVPASKGGSTCVSNLRMTHHGCNNSRKNEFTTFYMMKHLFWLSSGPIC